MNFARGGVFLNLTIFFPWSPKLQLWTKLGVSPEVMKRRFQRVLKLEPIFILLQFYYLKKNHLSIL
ncbi:MAG: hypothetical protein B6247_26000 [Candidatus Parabeggiatoa sp. nov. 2]|nr:MAG: hypothetical protein B6247_26000 [Beggiatoa sp. 4572_84]